MDALNLAYIAGFFDGEGSVTIHQNAKPSPRGKNPNHTLQVSIGNTDPRVLVRVHEEFGGGFCYRKRIKANHRKIAQWQARSRSALAFLEAIQPYIEMKCDQVAVAIAFQRSKQPYRRNLVSAETIAWRETQRQTIRSLNARAWIL